MKLYYIKNECGGMGDFKTFEEAQKALVRYPCFSMIEEVEAVKCPKCHEPEREDILEAFGKCLDCDKRQLEV